MNRKVGMRAHHGSDEVDKGRVQVACARVPCGFQAAHTKRSSCGRKESKLYVITLQAAANVSTGDCVTAVTIGSARPIRVALLHVHTACPRQARAGSRNPDQRAQAEYFALANHGTPAGASPLT